MRIRELGPLVLLACSTQAATYYVDYVGGSDANAGTSMGAPWKRCPGMAGFSASYTHAAGDRFIFKGGVTWPVAALPLMIVNSGTGASWDYYGTNATWYSGGSWSAPVFNDSYTHRSVVELNAAYVTMDGLELKGALGTHSYGTVTVYYDTCHDITFTNLYVHDWMPGWGDGQLGGIVNHDGNVQPLGWRICPRVKMTHCLVTDTEHWPQIHHTGYGTGCGASAIETVEYCSIHQITDGVQRWCIYIHDNDLYDFAHSGGYTGPNSPGDDTHSDATFLTGGSYGFVWFYNNWIHGDMDYDGWHAMMFYPSPWETTTFYAYNNLVESDNYPDILLAANGSVGICYAWNNTFVISNNFSSGYRNLAVYSPGTWHGHNNHWISEVTEDFGNYGQNGGTEDHYLFQTVAQANAAGYNWANHWAPTSPGSPTVGAGLNGNGTGYPLIGYDSTLGNTRVPVARSPAGAWDIGAFQYGTPAPPSNPIISVTPASINFGYIAIGSSATLTVSVSNIGTNTLSGTVSASAPFAVVSGGSFSGLHFGESATVTISFTPSVAGPNSGTITFNSNGGNTGVAGSGFAYPMFAAYPIGAALGGYTAYSVSGGCLIEPVNVGDPAVGVAPTGGGVAVYGFTIPAPGGNYTASMTVNAPNTGANSFFVNIDGDPTGTGMIWDVTNLTSGAQGRTVSWRGSGTDTSPQYSPKVWSLSAGAHYIVVDGREANCSFCDLTISAYQQGGPNPATSLSTNAAPFGYVALGAAPTITVWVTNSGTGVLTGTAAASGAPFSVIGGANYSLAAGASQMVTVRFLPVAVAGYGGTLVFADNGGGGSVSLSGICYPILASPFAADAGFWVTPFADSGGCLSQPGETDVFTGGVAVYGFTIAAPGDYYILATVNAPNVGQNSFFCQVDSQTLSPDNIWDIYNLTVGNELRPVSQRGTGTDVAPQFPTNIWTLTAGTHFLVLIGREADTIVCNFQIVSAAAPTVPPAIVISPLSGALLNGSSTNLTVTANGTAPLSYQWTHAGTNLPGATGTAIFITANAATAGDYAAVVTNLYGNATSGTATISVLYPPSITTQPQGLGRIVGQSASFNVSASGTAPLSYQWYKNGAAIPGATGTAYSIASVALSDAGNFYVIVTNPYGVVTSSVAVLSVQSVPTPPFILPINPISQTVLSGSSVQFVATVQGTSPITYQWRFGGSAVSGQTTTTLTLNNVLPPQSGTYTLAATNAYGYALGNCSLTVTSPPPPAGVILRVTHP